MIRNVSKYLVNCGLRRNISTVKNQKVVATATEPPAVSYDMAKFFTHTPDEGYIRHSPFSPIAVPNMTLDQYVWKDHRKWQDKIAILCGETGRKYTYAQLRDHSAAFAVRLQQPKFNLQHGDMVLICLPNAPEFPIAALGAIESGLVVTTVNPMYTADEIAKQIENSNAKLIIGTIDGYSILQAAVSKTQRSIQIITIKLAQAQSVPAGAVDFFDIINTSGIHFNDLQTYDTDPNSLAFLPYSSGTTGHSKGVMLSHNNITSNCEQIKVPVIDRPLIEETTNDFQDVLPSVLPQFHIYGFQVIASYLMMGTKLVTFSRFNPQTFLQALVMQKITVAHLVPPIINFLSDHNMVEAKHLSYIRSIVCGAAPMGLGDAERFLKKAGRQIDFLQCYGLTELSPVVLVNVRGMTNYGSVGGPTSSTEAKIVNVNDPMYKGLAANQSGELLVRGPQAMLGYFKNPEATAEMVVQNGWVRTGDIGYYDDNGYFYITDRLKELIKVKGFQVPPAELEEILRGHPKVADVGVVGVPHPVNGEVARAFVVKRPDVDVTEKELQDFVAEKVAIYKRLDGGVRFLSSIPKNTTGKIMRRQLKEQYCT